jgi:putative intracellular protease/amidase
VSTPLARLDGKRALFVIYNRFEEDEYGIPRAILEQLGVAVTVASSSLEIRTGTRGAKVQPDLLVERDDLIITADGPGRSREFGETIAAAMGE